MKHIAAGKNQHHYGFRGLAGRLAKIPVFDKMVFNAPRPKTNADKCVGCGICAKVCPVSNIEMVEKCAVNGNRCEFCLACVHFSVHIRQWSSVINRLSKNANTIIRVSK